MKFESINHKYTEKVAEYMAQGWYINASTMSGHQGEISKIDLTNGIDIIRIMLTTKNEWCRKDETSYRSYHFDTVILTVGLAQPENCCTPNDSNTWNTLWNERLDVLYTETFYEIGERRGGKWYGTLEEAKAAQDKAQDRYEASRVNDREDVTENQQVKKVVIKAVRREKGMKSVSPCEITKIVRRHTDRGLRYEVSVRNKTVVIKTAA